MSVTVKQIVASKLIEDAQTTQYTVGAAVRIIVDKFTVTNQTGTAATFSVNIVPDGGSVATSNRIINTVSVAANAVDLVPGMVGQVLEPSDVLSMIAGTASALTVAVSGREVTV